MKTLLRKIIPAPIRSGLRGLYIGMRYSGTRFECPFCNRRFGSLRPLGSIEPVMFEKKIIGARRQNAVCPYCYSFDRERLLLLFLKAKTDIFESKLKILHVAPEPHLQKVLKAAANLDYLSADLESPLAMVKMDITDIRYPDAAFDAIICNHVLEHIPDDKKAIAELFRVLKPGGWAILQVPVSFVLEKTYEPEVPDSPEARTKEFGQSDHVRIYGADYKARLENAGFSVELFNYAKEFGEEAAARYSLIKEEDIFFCKKPRHGEPSKGS